MIRKIISCRKWIIYLWFIFFYIELDCNQVWWKAIMRCRVERTYLLRKCLYIYSCLEILHPDKLNNFLDLLKYGKSFFVTIEEKTLLFLRRVKIFPYYLNFRLEKLQMVFQLVTTLPIQWRIGKEYTYFTRYSLCMRN